MPENLLPILSAFVITLVAHLIAKVAARRITDIPMLIIAVVVLIVFLLLTNWDYQDYFAASQPIFDHLLGYVVVLLAIPLASMDFTGLPLKRLSVLVIIGTLVGALLPMALAFGFSLSQETILSFSARAVTTPVGLSIGNIIEAPLAMVNLIIIVSGLLGAGFSKFLLKKVSSDRAKGLTMGLMAHAFGTIEAWQISPVAGRYAAFGLAVNGLITAIWVPIFIKAVW